MAPLKTKKVVKRGCGVKKRSGCGCAQAQDSSTSSSSSETSSSSECSSSDDSSSSSESDSDCSDSSDDYECCCAPPRKRGGKKVQAARQAKLETRKKRHARRTKHSTSYCSSDYDSSDESFQCSRKSGRKCRA